MYLLQREYRVILVLVQNHPFKNFKINGYEKA